MTVQQREVREDRTEGALHQSAEAPPAFLEDPIAAATRLRPPVTTGLEARFGASDPNPKWDVARIPLVARLLRSRRLQFFLILPNQIIFWTVIFVGVLGTAVPGLNFGTAITWYIWFCLVFVLMVVVGRAWCAMCPFGGFAEWVQRHTFTKRTQRPLGLGLTFPPALARLGFLIPVATFLVLTWIEEYFNIAGPGNPIATSLMVIGIVAFALTFFLVFERRTFCRYICPLTSLVGTVGSMGTAAGFRTRDRNLCLTCETKDCMRGGDQGFGCPWYTWPGSADSNLACGLCSECYKSCSHDNIGLFVQKPLTSVVATRRRDDVAWAVAILFGLVVYQQVNATNVYASVEGWLNSAMHFPHYPNPVAYIVVIGAVAALVAGASWLVGSAVGRRSLAAASRFRSFFVPIAYGLIPVMGADYFARQLPKFFEHAPRLIPATAHVFGASGTSSSLYSTSLLNVSGIVAVQVAVIALGTLASMWAMWRIANRELVGASRGALAVRVASIGLVAACGAGAAVLYVIMHAAS